MSGESPALSASRCYDCSRRLRLIGSVALFVFFCRNHKDRGHCAPPFLHYAAEKSGWRLRHRPDWLPRVRAASCGETLFQAHRLLWKAAGWERKSPEADHPAIGAARRYPRAGRAERPGWGAAQHRPADRQAPRICIRNRNRTVSSWNLNIMASNISKDSFL